MTLALCVGAPLAGAAAIALLGGRLAARTALVIAFASLAVALGAALVMTQAFVDGRSSVIAEIGRWLPVRGSVLALTATPASIPPLVAASLVPAAALAIIAARRTAAEIRPAAVAASLAAAALALIASATDLLLVVAGWHLVGLASALVTDRPTPSARTLAALRPGDIALLLAAAAYVALFATSDVGEMARRLDPSLPADALGRIRTSLLWPSVLVMASVVVTVARPLRATIASRRRAPSAPTGASLALAVTGAALLLGRLGPLAHPAILLAGGLVLAAAVLLRADLARLGRSAVALGGGTEAGLESALERSGVAVATAIHRAGSVVRVDEREHRVREAVMLAVATGMLAFWSLR